MENKFLKLNNTSSNFNVSRGISVDNNKPSPKANATFSINNIITQTGASEIEYEDTYNFILKAKEKVHSLSPPKNNYPEYINPNIETSFYPVNL
jgi:hypothetical protein